MAKLWKYFILVNVLNVIDILQTLFIINELYGIEINPLMAWLLRESDILFVVFKLSSCLLLTTVIVKYKKIGLLKIAAWMFGVVVTWNFINIIVGLW